VQSRPLSVVLDFFAGSGTTTHAVARLNRQDGGTRQSIIVTNNEVSADEAAQLRARGSRPGDNEWESLGIFEHITRPRIEAAITGAIPEGDPVRGDYKFNDEFPMSEGFEENVEFLELKYLDLEDVELDLAFESVAPLLWLRAGGTGAIIDRRCDDSGVPKVFDMTDRYGIIFDPDLWRAFVQKLPDTVTTAFVVTDSTSVFSSVAAELNSGVDAVRLYENYLSTFVINRGR
jgi:adenine-specific DNA-methyltransferase